jgi:hypothetical protein
MKWKEIFDILSNVCPGDFKILKKKQMKLGNHEICKYLMISYMEAMTYNKLVGFTHFVTYNAYKLKHLRKIL